MNKKLREDIYNVLHKHYLKCLDGSTIHKILNDLEMIL